MNRNDRIALLIFLALILLGFGLWWWRSAERGPEMMTPTPAPAEKTAPAAPVSPPKPIALKSVPPVKKKAAPLPPSPATSTKAAVPSADNSVPTAPAIPLHKELIPKDIEIVRCYYGQEVVPPGTSLSFDIDGSGFTDEFEKMISVTANEPEIRVKSLRLVTPNQIHGEMDIGPNAPTRFVFPSVLIKGLPVFQSKEPFAVIRSSDVLAIFFIQMQDNGRGGRFRVLTNLTPDAAKTFKIEPSTPGLLVSDLEPHLPYAIEGNIRIGAGVPPGDYGLVASIGGKEAFRRNGMIRIVRPTVGQSGLIHGVTAEEVYHRPGDEIQLYLEGTGLSPEEATSLVATVNEFDMGRGSFTYISPAQMRFVFTAPAQAPLGRYTVSLRNAQGEKVFEKKDAFELVPPNWVGGVQVTPPVHPGGQSTLRFKGRDFSPAFLQAMQIGTDDDGLKISGLRSVDASTLEAEISVSSSVAPGDYWLHLSTDGKKIDPPYGSIIKVEP